MDYLSTDNHFIEFEDLYKITDQSIVSMHQRALIVNFYRFILDFQNVTRGISQYKSDDKTFAFKEVLNNFFYTSINIFQKLHRKQVDPAKMCDMINGHINNLNENLELLARYYKIKKHQVIKIESKNDWVSPRLKSDWDIQIYFVK